MSAVILAADNVGWGADTPPILSTETVRRHRRSQDFLWGCAFFLKKVDDFLVVAPQNTGENY